MTQSSNTQQIFNILILDESGSMESIRPSIISSFNELIQTIHAAHQKGMSEDPKQEHFITLYIFNGEAIREVHFQAPVAQVHALSLETYHPNAGTPLFDTMGMALSRHETAIRQQPNAITLVTILTDGEENVSREYGRDAIIALVNRLREAGWVFTYIGTDHDVARVSAGIAVEASLSFSKSEEGVKVMMVKESSARMRFYERVKTTDKEQLNANKDYFKEDL